MLLWSDSDGHQATQQKQSWLQKAEKAVERRVPITQWLRTYTRVDAVSDLIAGITLGLTLIPQSIAYSSLAGVPPQVKTLYMFIINKSINHIISLCLNNKLFVTVFLSNFCSY